MQCTVAIFLEQHLVLNGSIGHICSQMYFPVIAGASHTVHSSAAAGGRMIQARSSGIDACW